MLTKEVLDELTQFCADSVSTEISNNKRNVSEIVKEGIKNAQSVQRSFDIDKAKEYIRKSMEE